jgi:hypothetical protein
MGSSFQYPPVLPPLVMESLPVEELTPKTRGLASARKSTSLNALKLTLELFMERFNAPISNSQENRTINIVQHVKPQRNHAFFFITSILHKVQYELVVCENADCFLYFSVIIDYFIHFIVDDKKSE